VVDIMQNKVLQLNIKKTCFVNKISIPRTRISYLPINKIPEKKQYLLKRGGFRKKGIESTV
jgi:hypothetical protein